jgi:outer membrane receptor protein involved in Fe transport
MAGFAATAAAAQNVAPAGPGGDDSASVDTIVVTGTRLQASGFTTPTPVTVLGAGAVEDRAKVNIADVLNEIPSFQPSSGAQQATRNITATFGLATVDLRGLGAARTLVLVDGRRFVPIAPSGVNDVSVIPTNLIDRVETVTGGASAAYGSDAVAGVVNFILRDRLEGIRASAQTGTSQHGGAQEWAINLAVGHGFANDRIHVIAGLDWHKNLGISTPYKRDWGASEPGFVGLGADRPAGVPANVLGYGEHFSAMTTGGIITSGPLKGTAFGPGGTPYKFNYGSLVGPSLMLGGDNFGYSDNSYRNLLHPTENLSTLARISFDVTPTTTVYVEGSYAYERVPGFGTGARTPAPFVVSINNPYLPDSVRQQMQAAGVTTFNMGRYTLEGGTSHNVTTNNVFRGVIGAKGTIFGDWKWDIYGETGETLGHNDYHTIIATRLYQAVDVIRGANGQPVCAPITTNPYYLAADPVKRQAILNTTNASCAPFNIFGPGQASQEAANYIQTTFNQRILTVQNSAAASISGSPFSTWAGPVSVAFGGEARRDGASQNANDFGINAAGDFVNLVPLNGSQNVYEFFGETGIPLLKDSPLGKALDFNAAVRQTHYEYSGWVTTWKVGGVYEPTDWLRIRATESRDIRAPRITELFQVGAANGANLTNPTNGFSAAVPTLAGGNPNLKPEVANTFTGGFVITPKWGLLDGLRLSMDYYHIALNGAIGTVGAADIINRYYNLHMQQYASFFTFDNSPIGFSRITTSFLNLNEILADGVDAEIAYRAPIDRLGAPGRLNISSQITWANRMQTIDSSSGTTVVTNRVGVNSGGGPIPRWRANVTFDYSLGRFATTVQMRAFSGFEINPNLIGPDSPAYNPKLQNSVNINRAPGMAYWSLSARYDIIRKGDQQLQVFGVIDNLFDKDPPISGVALTSFSGIPYDFIGRDFKVGVRLVM